MAFDRERLVLAVAKAALYPSVHMEGCPAAYRRTAERIADAAADALDVSALCEAHQMEVRVLYEALERALSHFAVMGGEQAACAVEEIEVRARPNNKGPRHTIWFARQA